jgi:hypothetical protein
MAAGSGRHSWDLVVAPPEPSLPGEVSSFADAVGRVEARIDQGAKEAEFGEPAKDLGRYLMTAVMLLETRGYNRSETDACSSAAAATWPRDLVENILRNSRMAFDGITGADGRNSFSGRWDGRLSHEFTLTVEHVKDRCVRIVYAEHAGPGRAAADSAEAGGDDAASLLGTWKAPGGWDVRVRRDPVGPQEPPAP